MTSKYAHLEYYKKRLEELGFKNNQDLETPGFFFMTKDIKDNKQAEVWIDGNERVFYMKTDSAKEGGPYHVKDLKWRAAFSQMIKDMPDEVLRID